MGFTAEKNWRNMFSGKIWRLGSYCIGKHLCARVPLALLALDCEHKRMLVMMMMVVMLVMVVVMMIMVIIIIIIIIIIIP